MNKKWLRTSFRLKPESELRLKSLCERSGYKQKEILDEVMRRGLEMNIFPEPIGKPDISVLPDVYKPWIELNETHRKTYEVTNINIEGIDKFVRVHDYLNRDQILNVLVFIVSESLSFPLKNERKKMQKIRPKIKRLAGLKKMIEKDIIDVLGKDTDALFLVKWDQLSRSLEEFEKAFDRWSSDTLFYKNKNVKTQGRFL